jgi:vacuolar-type H+-ATPase catalytic subunit A/Vma1
MELAHAKRIIHALNDYPGKSMDFDSIMKHITFATRGEVAQVIEFVRELKTGSSLAARVDLETPIDLATELSYNYQVAKAMLQDSLEQADPDKEDLRKTLTTIQKFMDSMLKMQEKVYNVQQMQRFQEAVMDVLQTHQLKEVIVRELLELPL